MTGLIPFNRRRNDLLGSGFEEFQNMLDDFFTDSWSQRRNLLMDSFKIDVQDNGGEYLIEAEVPGVQKNEIQLSLVEGKLKIVIEKEEVKSEEKKNYVHKERSVSSTQRTVILADADPEGISAKLEDGILKVILKKKSKIQASQFIEIE